MRENPFSERHDRPGSANKNERLIIKRKLAQPMTHGVDSTHNGGNNKGYNIPDIKLQLCLILDKKKNTENMV